MTKLFDNAIKAVNPNGITKEGLIPYSYDMSMEDMTELMEMALDGRAFEALSLAFSFGYVMGNRATINRKLKKL